jgi:hypothetical protein
MKLTLLSLIITILLLISACKKNPTEPKEDQDNVTLKG